jgi:hypothetical protein
MDNTPTPEAQPMSAEEHAAVQAAYAARQTVCSQCGNTYANAEDYRLHVCEKTGFAPTDQRHLGADFPVISEAAIERGAATGPVQG